MSNRCIAQEWSLVPEDLDPDQGVDGIQDILGPGDDTLPAWATRLVGNPRVQTVWAPDIHHMELMNHKDIQIAVANILNPTSATAMKRLIKTARTVKLRAASRSEMNRLVRALGKVRLEEGKERREKVRTILLEASKGDPDRLQRLFARAYLDALRTPSQKLGKGKPRPVK